MFKKLLTLAAFAAAVMGANAEDEWVNILENGDAEGEYGAVPCAVSKVDQGAVVDCAIVDEDGNHVFAVNATAMKENPWDNQFWIVAPVSFKTGDTFRVSFKYKAAKEATVGTQAHAEPGNYLHWACIGNVSFKPEWQEYYKEVTVESAQNGMSSIAFNLNDFTEANDYYFDDLVWEINGNPIEWPENCVWLGEKECNWGDPVTVGASVFANVKAGDVLKVWTSEASCQIILGGWSGLNLGVYGAAGIENMTYEDGVATVTMVESYGETVNYGTEDEPNELNVFDLLKANGVVIQGPTTITRVDYIPAETEPEIETSEYTVWVGPKQCAWGDAVYVPAEAFANVKVDDELKVWSTEWGCQIILGGWSGLNLPIYGCADIDNMDYIDGVATIKMIPAYGEVNNWGTAEDPQEINVFELMKANGVVIQGPTIISRVDFIPAEFVSVKDLEIVNAPVEYYNLQGVRVDNPSCGIFIVKQGNKVSKQVIR